MKKRFAETLLVLALSLFSGAAIAAQGSGCLPTTGIVSGLTQTQNMNAAIAALISSNSGASAPTTDCTLAAVKGQVWLDTSVTPNVMRQYDGSSWVALGALDATNHLWAPPIGGGISSIASSTTTDIGSLPHSIASVTGTTTITSLGSTNAVIGQIKVLIFNASLTLTHNGTSLILPGGQNIQTAAGDSALVVNLGSGNWRVVSYSAASSGSQMAAYTLRGNATGARATPTDITIAGLPAKASPTSADELMISDTAASGALKKIGGGSLGGLIQTGTCLTSASNTFSFNPSCSIGYLSGLLMATAGSTNVFSVQFGVAVDSTSTEFMILSSSYTKTTGSWAVGSGNGSLDTGSIASSTWYHAFLIKRPDTGVVDICISTSAAGCAGGVGNIPSAYTARRRIGSMKTDGSLNWVRFAQYGDEFYWYAPTTDLTQTGSGPSGNFAINVPTGIKVRAHVSVNCRNSGGILILKSLDVGSYGGAQGSCAGAGSSIDVVTTADVWTDTSQTIAVTNNGGSTWAFVLSTLGWTDLRNR